MTIITVSMEWKVEEGFNYRIMASEEVPVHGVSYTRRRLHDLCRQHRQAVEAAIDAYYQRRLHQSTANGHAAWAAGELANAEKNKDNTRYSIQNDVARKSAARRQAAAGEAQVKADAIEIDEDWLPW